MDGWHHRLNGHEFEQTLGDSEGQGSLVNCSRGSGGGRSQKVTRHRMGNHLNSKRLSTVGGDSSQNSEGNYNT